jgi:trimeric autotransporter adhesin
MDWNPILRFPAPRRSRIPRRLFVSILPFAILAVWLTVGALLGAEHHGVVKANGLPVPGATITMSQGDKKFVTTTDENGAYSFSGLPDGVYNLEVEMFGFSKITRQVGIAQDAPSPEWELKVLPLSEMKQQAAPAPSPEKPAPAQTAAATPAAPVASNPPTPAPANRPSPNQASTQTQGPAGGGQGRYRQGGNGSRPSINQALAQNGYQQLGVNASANGEPIEPDNGFNNGSAPGEFASPELNQSASDSLIVNGSVSSGLGLPQQNDWFGFGRGGNAFGGPGGPGEPGGPGGPNLQAQLQGPGGPGGGGPGGGRGGFGGGGGRGGFGGNFRGGRGGRGGRNPNAFGNGRRNRRNRYTGNVALILNNSNLNANSFSLNGLETPKPAYNNFRLTGSIGGPLKIPHIFDDGKTAFVLNYQFTRNRTANVLTGLVPTEAERNGDFSGVVDPLTKQPITLNSNYPNNQVPLSLISPQAQGLLSLYPLPNFNSSTYNYQIPAVTALDQDNVNMRITRPINSKNQVSGQFAWQQSTTRNPSLFGFVDNLGMTGYNTSVQYTYHFTNALISNLRYQFSRQATQTTPYFSALGTNVSGNLGILGNDQSPSFYGPPALSFTSGFYSLSDANYSLANNTTNAVSENLIWVHGKHNVTFGGDFRRLDFNQISQQNPRGSFSFTGEYTGFDFADFLLGYPGTSSIAYGNADKYFRASWADTFVTDDWRLSSKLTLNLGVRWDFQAPVTELYNRLVNLEVGPYFTSTTPVCGTISTLTSGPACTLAGQVGYPDSLVRPNYHEIQPRIGVAWRPFDKGSTVVRAGYGIYYNTSVYQPLANQMAQQAPLSYSITQQNSLTSPYTIANAFLVPATGVTSQTFALDPNFQIGYLHYWQIAVQQGLGAGFVLTATYAGDKGLHQVQEFYPQSLCCKAPDSDTPAPTIPYPVGYIYETSGGQSSYNAGSIQLQRRFRSGLSGNILYVYSKAMDDSQGVGGRGAASTGLAQNWLDLAAEESLSSFNRTHTLNFTTQYSTGQGQAGGALLSGWRGALAKDWTFAVTMTVGSGLPETPIASGWQLYGPASTGTVRAQLTGLPVNAAPAGLAFNPSAFLTTSTGGAALLCNPALPSGVVSCQFGNAGRNSLTGPMQFTLNGSAGRVFRVGERRSFDIRFDATNILNTVTFTSYNATIGNAQFGLPVAANAMRAMTANLRFRF